jgi:hypothetical protein
MLPHPVQRLFGNETPMPIDGYHTATPFNLAVVCPSIRQKVRCVARVDGAITVLYDQERTGDQQQALNRTVSALAKRQQRIDVVRPRLLIGKDHQIAVATGWDLIIAGERRQEAAGSDPRPGACDRAGISDGEPQNKGSAGSPSTGRHEDPVSSASVGGLSIGRNRTICSDSFRAVPCPGKRADAVRPALFSVLPTRRISGGEPVWPWIKRMLVGPPRKRRRIECAWRAGRTF